MTRIEPLGGTDESEWARWGAPADWPRFEPARLAGTPVVVLAAHPDDEVLGVGGLVCLLVAAGARLRFVWATDGEASHPSSTATAVRGLARARRAESATALARLGAGAAGRVRLGLPDGALSHHEADLVRRLRAVIDPSDTVLSPWSGDAHPDHEACGRAARDVAATVLEYPVWAWHWAHPDDERVPWSRARRVDLPCALRSRKASAVECFHTQVRPLGPRPEDGPVLPRRVLEHFARDYEVLFA